MFCTTYQLRLSDETRDVTFYATDVTLRAQLNRAFIQLICGGGSRSAKLEVCHDYHGWHLVCVNHCYFIIKSPLNLDYPLLQQGIRETLSQCNEWPTDEQKAAHKAKLIAQERQLDAQIRRNRFTLID